MLLRLPLGVGQILCRLCKFERVFRDDQKAAPGPPASECYSEDGGTGSLCLILVFVSESTPRHAVTNNQTS